MAATDNTYDARALAELDNEAAWIASIPREPDSSNVVDMPGHRSNGHTPPSDSDDRPRRLPDEFWTARPVLEHIRTAARSRMVGPDALFAATLARVCAAVDYRIGLPGIVGSRASLNLIVAVVGASGAGKGAALGTSDDLLRVEQPTTDYRVGEVPAGSGEGMVHAFFELVQDPDDKRRKIPRRRYEGVLVRVDEGQVLTALAQRSGQTTMETLRQGFSGERLGGSYASSDKRLTLDGHGYRLSLLIGVQPEHARMILDDSAGGTPQRFLWFDALDPDAPEPGDLPDWPGPIDWQPPCWWGDTPVIGGEQHSDLDVHPDVRHAIQADRHRRLRGNTNPGRYDGQRTLIREKIAALLGILDGRRSITPDDWTLAGIVSDTSDAERDSMWSAINADQASKDAAWNLRHAARAAAEESARLTVTTNVARIARGIGRRIAKLDPNDTISRGQLRKALASDDRQWFEEAASHAEGQGWLTIEDDGRCRRGDSVPA